MVFHLSKHAEQEMKKRGIPRDIVQRVLDSPDRKLATGTGEQIYQSAVEMQGKAYVVRVIVSEEKEPPVVVTVYRSSKLAKYGGPE